MRKLLASILLFAVSHSAQITGVGNRKVFPVAGGGISFLAKGCSGTTSSTTLACSSSITSVPSGATLLIWISDTAAGTVSVTDTGSHTSLAVVSGYPCTYHGSSQGTIWIETGAASGTHTISSTIPVGGGQIVVVAATGGTVDASSGTGSTCGASTFSATATTPNLTTAHTNELAFMFVGDTGATTTYTFAGTPINLSPAGFSSLTSDAGYGTIATITTTNGVATLNAGSQWVAELVALH